jgi:hypothetical protein
MALMALNRETPGDRLSLSTAPTASCLTWTPAKRRFMVSRRAALITDPSNRLVPPTVYSWRRGICTAAVWPDAAADLGSAGVERVALRLRLRNLRLRERCLRNRLGGTSGARHTARKGAAESRSLARAALVSNFLRPG